MKYKVGVCQFKPKLLDLEYNLKKMENILSGVEADLIVLPELVTSGYIFCEKKEVQSMAEKAEDGPTSELFRRLSKKKNTSYVVGFVEEENNKFYNSAMLVNPDGEIFVYRKIQLFFEEKFFFEYGDLGFNVFKAKKGVRVGLMICFDWIYPEAARTLALKGAQIIAHPANLVLPWCQQAMITRSIENQVYTITANRIGKEINRDKELIFTGHSQIVSSKGEIIKRLSENEETVFITEIDPELADDKKVTIHNDVLKDRMTMYYK